MSVYFLVVTKHKEVSMDTKKSNRIPLGTPRYHRLTMEKRIIIWTLKKAGKSQSEMANMAIQFTAHEACRH